MKILHELNQLEMGGAERVVAGIIKHDQNNEHVIYTYKDGPMRGILEKAGAKIIVENDGTEKDDCDIIHVHTGGAESYLAGMVKGQITTVETVHSPVVSAVRDGYVCARVGVSKVVMKKNRKCRTIYNGVDLERLNGEQLKVDRRKELGIPKEDFVIGRLGRIGTDKCVEEFLIACKSFQEKEDCHILIVGNESLNDPGYLATIKVMVASLPLQNVHFVGNVEDVGGYYNAMDVFLYPSPTEGFGLVYLEAMACGVPVITYKNALTCELLMGQAFLTENKIPDLVAALNILNEDPGLRSQFADAGLDHVMDHFTERKMSKGYQSFYDEIYDQFVREE